MAQGGLARRGCSALEQRCPGELRTGAAAKTNGKFVKAAAPHRAEHSAGKLLHRRTGSSNAPAQRLLQRRCGNWSKERAMGLAACAVKAACEGTARTYACARCQGQVLVCSDCDRGQRYCSARCRQQARRDCLREAGRRYQGTRAGRFAHARRAARYRQRQKKVTHQGSQGPPACTTVQADLVELEVAQEAVATVRAWQCFWCGCACLPVVRRGFLRHNRVRCQVAPNALTGAVRGQSP